MLFKRVIRVGIQKFQVKKVIFDVFGVETEPNRGVPDSWIWGFEGQICRFPIYLADCNAG